VKNKKSLKKFAFIWAPSFFWALVIFLFSARPTNPVSEIHLMDFIVKKSAHVFEYAVLTILLYRAFILSGFDKNKAKVYSVTLSIFYGITDEFHQLFVPGRTAKVRDVFIDGIGAVLAIYLINSFFPKAPCLVKKIAGYLQIL